MSDLSDVELTNDALFARLARIADEIDPVPSLTYELGRAAFELRRVNAELAELVRDSATDPAPLAGVRGESDIRLLSFEAADLDVDLQVMLNAGRWSLLGQVMGTVTELRVETAEGVVPMEVDQHGRFQLADLAGGRMRLHVHAGGSAFVTSWVTI